ncbi:hypothetical protein JCM19047_3576 [Bacillus sp. JCM 19047]|nr:hypothetical protein JCM19047_3576 [Bacillus sp. JCM 19047]
MKESNHQQVLEDDIVTITDKELVDELKRLSNIDKKQLNRPGTKEITELKWNGSLLKLAGYAL